MPAVRGCHVSLSSGVLVALQAEEAMLRSGWFGCDSISLCFVQFSMFFSLLLTRPSRLPQHSHCSCNCTAHCICHPPAFARQVIMAANRALLEQLMGAVTNSRQRADGEIQPQQQRSTQRAGMQRTEQGREEIRGTRRAGTESTPPLLSVCLCHCLCLCSDAQSDSCGARARRAERTSRVVEGRQYLQAVSVVRQRGREGRNKRHTKRQRQPADAISSFL